ncbi:hypothetical protein QBC41DRAFT_310935 [Cercophora samala]|uniref:AMP-activated protein kinase glycogen-binding domain-containing protein n=1 Tax=Cercophora samala TaxID=330535 RepID=A0AA40DHM7_9PEZI|nr:hypothetical protein QBC41DRAFT_310935 [Cercophora samala]
MPSDKIPIVVTYEKPGTQPPIYVAGTFSNPPWTPEEMSYTTEENGEHLFTKQVFGEVGSKHQYKFRIGNGDWWDLAPGQPTVTDASGNTNHELEIQPPKESKIDSTEDKGPAELSEDAQAPNEPVEVNDKSQAVKEPAEVPQAAEVSEKPTEVVEETQAAEPVDAPKEVEAPKPIEDVEETEAPKEQVEAPKEDETPAKPTEVVEETEAPKEPVEVPKEVEASKKPAEVVEETEAPKEAVEVPEEVEAPKKPIEVVEETEAPKEVEAPKKPAEVVEETEAPKEAVKVPEEDEAPKQPTEVVEETEAPEEPVEVAKEVEAPKKPTEVVEETQAPKEAVEVPEEVETPEKTVETSEQPEASKEPITAPEQPEAPKEQTEVPEEIQPQESQPQEEPADVPEEKAPKISAKDSTTTNIVLPNESILQAIKAQEIRTQSGTGTPDFVRTAAEVADSAALLNEGVPAKDPRDGLLERAPTPMSTTAETAAEVADTAEVLDQVDTILISEPHADDDSLLGPPSASQGDEFLALKSPLFPHECPSPPTPGNAVERRESSDDRSPLEDIDPDQIDLNDPTLERFPSNREEIIDTVRKLETSLNEDQASFEGAPPSPVINSPLEGTQDITDYILGDSSIPTSHRGSQHLEVPRPSHGSASSVPVSPSLQVISEAEEPTNEENGAAASPIVFSNPDMKPRPSSLKPRSEEDDEGVSLKDSISPRTAEPPVADKSATHAGSKTASDILFKDTPPLEASGAATPTRANGFALADDSNTAKVADQVETQNEIPAASATAPVGERATDGEIAESSHTTALDTANNTISLKKRGVPAPEVQHEVPRVTSPISNRPTGVEHNGVGWLQAFFRLLFVDIIGGFISRLCGGKKRNTTYLLG